MYEVVFHFQISVQTFEHMFIKNIFIPFFEENQKVNRENATNKMIPGRKIKKNKEKK